MIRFFICIVVLLNLGCSTDALNVEENLNDSLSSKRAVRDNVIACAASSADDDKISVFFYPRAGATNFQYFETKDASVDKNDFDNYTQFIFPVLDVFNGYLKKFEIVSDTEKWVIVSFDEAGKIHLSNPIRLKQNSKPTKYLANNISIDATTNMPNFSWKDGSYSDTKIYFQVVSDETKKLLSGTYTTDKKFKYYSLDNVVLNITKGTPPKLKPEEPYDFMLMGVSEDNWVNLFSETTFRIE